MFGATVQALEPHPAAAAATTTAATSSAATTAQPVTAAAMGAIGCGSAARGAGPPAAAATMEHVLLALRETEVGREARISGVFAFFDAAGRGHLDHAQIVAGLVALRVPEGAGGGGAGAEDYVRALLRACNRDCDGRIGYDDLRRYMDDKELELYRIFQGIDVEHTAIDVWHALVKAGMATAVMFP